MPRKRVTHERIAVVPRHAEHDATAEEACRKMGVSEPTSYRWKKQFVGMCAEAQSARSTEKRETPSSSDLWPT